MSPTFRAARRTLLALLVAGAAVSAWTAHRHFGLYRVDGRSMEPTFQDGDLLWVDRLAYRDTPVERDDVVIALHRGDLLVKRVVGLGGEIIEVQHGTVLVDGYPVGAAGSTPGTMELRAGLIPPGQVALLGDHRSMHPGEHIHAVVPNSNVLGRVIRRVPLPRL